MLSREIDSRTCVSKQYVLEQIFIITYIGMIIFFHEMKSLIVLITFIFYIISFLYIFYKNKKFNNLDKWEEAEAKVINAKAIGCLCFTAYNTLEKQRLRKESYKPEIIYRYEYKGEIITSDHYAISLDDVDCNFSYTKDEAKKIAAQARKNKRIKIYINQDTGQSVITLKVAKGYGIPYVLFMFISPLFLWMLYKAYTY